MRVGSGWEGPDRLEVGEGEVHPWRVMVGSVTGIPEFIPWVGPYFSRPSPAGEAGKRD